MNPEIKPLTVVEELQLYWRVFRYYCYVVKRFLTRDMWWILWNRTIKAKWYAWRQVPQDEFDKSLNLDMKAMLVMNEKQLHKYYADIQRRRKIAHDREFAEDIKEGERSLKEKYGLDLDELRELNKTAEKYLRKK